MSGEKAPNVAPGTEFGENAALEADADAFLAAAGYDETGRNPAQEEAEKREWQTMGLEKDVDNVSRDIAEKAYDNMAGPDSSTTEGREYQIDAVENTVKEAAPKIAGEAYDIMTTPNVSMDSPEELGNTSAEQNTDQNVSMNDSETIGNQETTDNAENSAENTGTDNQ